jgi:hypothetical protein
VKTVLAVLVCVLLSVRVASGAGGDPDPATLAAALQVLPTLRSASFDGPYARYRGYLSETGDQAFTAAYRSAFTKAVPPAIVAHDRWMMPWGGVEVPTDIVGFDGTSYLWAVACRPHDCPNGRVFVLYDPVAHVVWGAAQSDEAVFVFGDPTERQRGFLLDMVTGDVLKAENGFRDDPLGMIRKVLNATGGSFTRVVLRRF